MLESMNQDLADISVVNEVDEIANSVSIKLGDENVKLIANFANISNIQKATGKGEVAIIMQFSRADFSIVDIATIIYHAIEEKDGRGFTIDSIGNAVISSKKYAEYAAAVVGFLGLMMDDNKKPGKPVKTP